MSDHTQLTSVEPVAMETTGVDARSPCGVGVVDSTPSSPYESDGGSTLVRLPNSSALLETSESVLCVWGRRKEGGREGGGNRG